MTDDAVGTVAGFGKLLRAINSYGWLLVAGMLALGFRFSTPSSELDGLRKEIAGLTASVQTAQQTMNAMSIKVQWQVGQTCGKLPPGELRAASTVCPP